MRQLILFAALLPGCTNLVPSTVLQASRLSPTTADPAQLAVALTLPEGIGIIPGSARLTFSAARSDTGETTSGEFILAQSGEGVAVFRIAPADQPLLRELQAEVRVWQAENAADTSGSVSVLLGPCLIGAGPAQDATVSVDVQWQEGTGFRPLLRDAPLVVVASEEQLRLMEPCTGQVDDTRTMDRQAP